MFRIDVRFNLKQFGKELDALARDQIPFATARALTLTARDARDILRRTVARNVMNRNKKHPNKGKWIKKGIQSRSATKRMPVASVGSVDWFMADQEAGGKRLAKRGSHRALPVGIGELSKGKTTRAWQPKGLLKKGGRRKFFMARLKSGRWSGRMAILRRIGKERYPLQLLYVMQASTDIRPKFWFRRTVERVVEKRLHKNFNKALAGAMATRRK